MFTQGEKMAIIMNGKALAERIRQELREEVSRLKLRYGRSPSLTVVLVGGNPASQIYVRNKVKAAKEVGIDSRLVNFDESVTQKELEGIIRKFNDDRDLDGFLIQLPLPRHIDYLKLVDLIDPSKDVDGFHPVNVGKLVIGTYDDALLSCTPLGVMKILKNYNIDVKGKNVTIVGASNIVGKPLAAMMLNAGATVSVCHILTRDVRMYTRKADIVCSATGVPGLIKEDMVKEGVVVIDIGISKVNGKIVGDVDFDGVCKKASAITPVPGGIGPMTVAMLLHNTVKAFKMRLNS